MNPTTTPPPAPTDAVPASDRRHSTRRVLAAAAAGIALGIAGVILLMPAPLEGVQSSPPAVTDTTTADGTTATGGDTASVPTGVVGQAAAEQAALAYVGEGRVTWVTPEDDRGAAWEIEVTLPSGREVDVLVDAAGTVIDARQGLARWLP